MAEQELCGTCGLPGAQDNPLHGGHHWLVGCVEALQAALEAERSGRRGFNEDEVLAVGQLMARVAELEADLQAERERVSAVRPDALRLYSMVMFLLQFIEPEQIPGYGPKTFENIINEANGIKSRLDNPNMHKT